MEKFRGFISVFCVIVILIAGFLMVKSIFYSDANTVVPDVVGMKSQEAVTAMKDAGFLPFIDRVVASAAPDTVVSQSFEAGKKQAKGATIYLRVSKGDSAIEIPDVTGMPLTEATKKFEELGLTVDRVKNVKNKEYAPGTVIAQNPSSPQTVDTSTKIILMVSSNGDETDLVKVPNVLGKSQEEATNLIEAAGLKLGEIKLKNSTKVAEGCVVSQTPNFDLSVSSGTAVSITVSSSEALDDLSIETEEPKKTAPIKRVVVENREELDREAANENAIKAKKAEQKKQKLAEQKKQSAQQAKKQQEALAKKKQTAQKQQEAKKKQEAVKAQEAKKKPEQVTQKPKTEQKQAAAEPQVKQTSEKPKATEQTKVASNQSQYAGKIAKIRYQTPPITGNNMSLKIVMQDDNGTKVLRDGIARSLEYISLNARYKGTAKITIYLGGEEVWHDKYN